MSDLIFNFLFLIWFLFCPLIVMWSAFRNYQLLGKLTEKDREIEALEMRLEEFVEWDKERWRGINR